MGFPTYQFDANFFFFKKTSAPMRIRLLLHVLALIFGHNAKTVQTSKRNFNKNRKNKEEIHRFSTSMHKSAHLYFFFANTYTKDNISWCDAVNISWIIKLRQSIELYLIKKKNRKPMFAYARNFPSFIFFFCM